MTADLLRQQLHRITDALPASERRQAFDALLCGANTALARAQVIGVEGALRELAGEVELLEQSAPDADDEATRMDVPSGLDWSER